MQHDKQNLPNGDICPHEVRSSAIKTKLCASCGESKPSKDFNRRLTIAQSRAVLNNPKINSRYIATSKNCSECRQQRKRRTPLSVQDIKNKMATGDINRILGEAIVKQKIQAIPRRRSKIMKEYWEKKRLGWIDELKTNLQKQVTAYANRYYSYKNTLSDQEQNLMTPAQHALLSQHSYNYKEAQRVRKDLMEKAKAGTSVPTDIKIETQIKRRKVGAV